MRNLYILFFVVMAVFFAENASAQLTIDEGTITVQYESFKTIVTNSPRPARDHIMVRTKINTQFNCPNGYGFPIPSYLVEKPITGYVGSLDFDFSDNKTVFDMEVNIYRATSGFTDDFGNCKDGAPLNKRSAELTKPFSVDISTFDFENSDTFSKTYQLNPFYWVTYEFRLTPKNTFGFNLSTSQSGESGTYENVAGPICLDEKLKIELTGDDTSNSGIDVASIEYEFQFNNETYTVLEDNPDWCENDCDSNPRACCFQPKEIEVAYPKFRKLLTNVIPYDPINDEYKAEGIDLSTIIPNILDAYKDAEGNLDLSAKKIKFRSRVILENGQIALSGGKEWKTSGFYTVSLGFPDFEPTGEVTPACYGEANGSISFNVTNTLGYTFEELATFGIAGFLKQGSDEISESYTDAVIAGNKITLTNIPGGSDYSMQLFFAGYYANAGNDYCDATIYFDMPELPPLELASENPVTVINPVCFNGLGSAIVKLIAIEGMDNVTFALAGQVVEYTAMPDESVGGEVVKVFRLNNLPVGENQVVDISVTQIRAGADNCSLQIQSPMISIVAPERVTANAPTINPATCNLGYNAGVVLQNLKGGSGSYLIRILDGGGNEVSRGESTTDEATVAVSSTGSFKVKVNDLSAQSCDGATFDIVLNPVEALTLTEVSTVDNACASVSEGRITGKFEGTEEGVVALYDNDGTLVSEQTNSFWSFSDLTAGNYEIKLRRSASCNDEVIQIVEIKEPKAFDIDLGETPISCDGANDGVLTATVDNFGVDYATKWYKDGVPLSTTELAISNLNPGNYTLEITPVTLGGVQCTPYEKYYEITEPTTVTAEVLSDAINCLDPPNNDLLIDNLSGGSNQFNIEIYKDGNLIITENNYSSNSFLAKNIDPGSYEVKIVDTQRPTCSGFENSFTIAPLEPLDLSVDVMRHNDCYGDNQGKIGINWKGNRAIFQILDADNNIIVETSLEDNIPFEIDTLVAGTYETVLLRSPGCNEKEVQHITITEPANMSFDFSKVDIACFGLETGEINGTLTGGTGNYQWEWFKDGTTMNIAGEGSDIGLKSITDGDYSLHITDDNSCLYQFDMSIIPLSEPMQVDFTIADISCLGEADGWIKASVQGGTQPYNYQWSDENNNQLSDSDNRLEVEKPGDYFLTITDNLGCQTFDTLFVYEPPGIDFPDNINLCKDDQFKAVLSYPENDVVYAWTADNGFSSSDSVVILNTTGDYTASVTRPNGCRYEHTFTVKMLDVEFLASFLGASWVEVGDTVYLKEVSRPKPDSITWDFPEGLLVDYDSLGDPYIFADIPGDYTIGMYGYKDSCMSYVSQVFTYSEKGKAPKLVDEGIFGPKGIEEYKIYPNPTDGNFEIEIKLFNKEEAAVFLYDVNGDEKWRARGEDKDEYNFSPHLTNLQSGVHILMLVTPSSRETIKVIVQ